MPFLLPENGVVHPSAPLPIAPGLPKPTALFLGSQNYYDYVNGRRQVITGSVSTGIGPQGQSAIIQPTGQNNIVIGSVDEVFPDTYNATIVIFRRKLDSTLRASVAFGYTDAGGFNRVSAHLPYSNGTVYFDFGNDSTGRLSVSGLTFTQLPECWVLVAGQSRGREIWRNGIRVAANANNIARPAATNVAIGSNVTAFGSDYEENYLTAVFPAALSPSQCSQISKNPWQIFASGDVSLFFDGAVGGATAIAGDAQSTATDTGSVDVSLGIAASSISIATDTGTISVAENLSGIAASISTDTGTPTVQISVSGSALSQAITQALANVSASIGGGANASSLDAGQVSIIVQLSGADIAQASTNGTLISSDNIQLSSTVNSTASVQGTTSIGVPLSGTEVSISTTTGNLTVFGVVNLTASLLNNALSMGSLELTLPLAANLTNQSINSGTLTVVAPHPAFDTDRLRTLTFLF